MIRRQFLKTTGAALGVGFTGTATGKPHSTEEAAINDPIDVKVFVVTAFEVVQLKKRSHADNPPGEFQLWYQNYDLTNPLVIPGAFAPVYYNDHGVAGTITGIGKTNAATSLTAILQSPQLDFENTYFVTAGIAGTPPNVGTLSSVFVSDYVTD